MLLTAEQLAPSDQPIRSNVYERAQWAGLPVAPFIQELRIFLGDQLGGPVMWFIDAPPVEFPSEEDRTDVIIQAAHRHRSPTFRMPIGDEPRQLMLNKQWFGFGDFMLMDANTPYSEGTGVKGFRYVLVFADRRGVPTIKGDTASLSAEELMKLDADTYGSFNGGIRSAHTSDDQATCGVSTLPSTGDASRRTRGSIEDDGGWRRLKDGSTMIVARMGEPSGPAVILTNNASGAVEPSVEVDSDVVRLVLKGTCTIGDQPYGPGDLVGSPSGTTHESVVHGPSGSSQMFVMADGSALSSAKAVGEGEGSERLSEMLDVFSA